MNKRSLLRTKWLNHAVQRIIERHRGYLCNHKIEQMLTKSKKNGTCNVLTFLIWKIIRDSLPKELGGCEICSKLTDSTPVVLGDLPF